MIFATVGTHEDPFNRLLQALDDLVASGKLEDEEVVCQSGYCDIDAPNVTCHTQLPFDDLQALMRDARIIITHGGPASIMQALAHGKIPIVVPRQADFGEHVDNHQCRFAEKMSNRVLVVFDIEDLEGLIVNYKQEIARFPASDAGPDRAKSFAKKLDALCSDLLAAD